MNYKKIGKNYRNNFSQFILSSLLIIFFKRIYDKVITHIMNRNMVILSNNPPIEPLFAIEAAPAPPEINISIAVTYEYHENSFMFTYFLKLKTTSIYTMGPMSPNNG